MNNCLNFQPKTIGTTCVEAIMAMSTKHFDYVNHGMGFRLYVDDKLRKSCRQFIADMSGYFGFQVPSNYKAYSKQDVDEEILIEAWDDLMVEFADRAITYTLCKWLRKLIFEDEEIGNIGSILLNHWTLLLLDFALGEIQDFPDSFDDELKNKIRVIVLKNVIQNVRFKFDKIKHKFSEDDPWEATIVENYGVWMRNRIQLHGVLVMWKNIFDITNPNQLRDLDDWGKKLLRQKYKRRECISIVHLFEEISVQSFYDIYQPNIK